jgi:hypothetical protein
MISLQEIAWIGTSLSGLGVFASVILAARSLALSRENQRRTTASNLWDSYLGRAIEFPEFAYPEAFFEQYDFKNRTYKGKKEEFERYEWFLSALLRSSDDIIESYDKTDERILLVERNIGYHRHYISWRINQKRLHDYLDEFGPKITEILRKISADVALDKAGLPLSPARPSLETVSSQS